MLNRANLGLEGVKSGVKRANIGLTLANWRHRRAYLGLIETNSGLKGANSGLGLAK